MLDLSVYLYKTGYPTVHLLATLFSLYTDIASCGLFCLTQIPESSIKSAIFLSGMDYAYILITYIVIYISWGDGFLGRILSASFSDNPKTLYLLDALKEVVFYFLIPFFIYNFFMVLH